MPRALSPISVLTKPSVSAQVLELPSRVSKVPSRVSFVRWKIGTSLDVPRLIRRPASTWRPSLVTSAMKPPRASPSIARCASTVPLPIMPSTVSSAWSTSIVDLTLLAASASFLRSTGVSSRAAHQSSSALFNSVSLARCWRSLASFACSVVGSAAPAA